MSLGNIKKLISDLENAFNLDEIDKQINEAKNTLKIKESYKLNLQGFELVNKPVVNDGGLPGSAPTEQIAQVGLALQTTAERANDLITRLESSDKTDLNNIVGDARLVAEGVLNVAVSAPFPEALAKTLQATTTATKKEIEAIVAKNNFANLSDIEKVVGNTFNSLQSISTQLQGTVSSLAVETNNFINNANKGFAGLIENLVEELRGDIKGTVSRLAIKDGLQVKIPPNLVTNIIKEIDKGNYAQAASLLAPFSDSTKSQIETELKRINTKASDTLQPLGDAQTTDVKTTNVTELTNLWNDDRDVLPKQVFAIIGKTSREVNSIQKEIANLKREFTEVIITPQNAPGFITIDQLHLAYREEFNSGFNPHLLVNPNGTLQRGRPLELEAKNVAKIKDSKSHYKRSILVSVFAINNKINSDQFNTLSFLLKTIIEVKPGVLIYQMSDVSPSAIPFELDQFFSTIPGYSRLSTDIYNPLQSEPLTESQLAVYLNAENEKVGPL